MRTTLQVDDDIYEAVRSLAAAEGRSFGEVLSALARRGLAPRVNVRERNGFPIVQVTGDERAITPELVKKALDDG